MFRTRSYAAPELNDTTTDMLMQVSNVGNLVHAKETVVILMSV